MPTSRYIAASSQQSAKGGQPIKTLTISELVPLLGDEAKQLVLLSGIQASGKSTFAQQLRPFNFDYHNADAIREELYGDESIFGDPREVFELLRHRLRCTLARGGKAVVDVTNVTRRSRQEYHDLGKEYGYPPCSILFMDVPVATSLARNQMRSRHVDEHIVMSTVTSLLSAGLPTREEGKVLFLRPGAVRDRYGVLTAEDIAAEELSPETHATELPISHLFGRAVLPAHAEKTDIIGDVHGCFDELLLLLEKLGHTLKFTNTRRTGLKVTSFQAARGRKLQFVGDLADRGPKSGKVLALVAWLVNNGHAVAVAGNHDERLRRYLHGDLVHAERSLKTTAAQLRWHSRSFRRNLRDFLDDLPLIHQTEHLVTVHAAYRADADGRKARELALYGEVSADKLDAQGRRLRQTKWEEDYAGTKTIVRGHDVILKPTLKLTRNGGWIANVDTGCAYGNALTAFRFPEMYFVSVPAKKEHVKPDFPLK